MIIIILLVSLPFDSQADSYTYKNYSVERWMGLDFVQKYSLVFQMRRAIRLGMQWGHPRAAKKGVVLTVGDESFGAGCLLHASTGTVMDEIEAVAKKNPEIKEWGLFQAVAAVVLVECKSFGDSVSDFNLNQLGNTDAAPINGRPLVAESGDIPARSANDSSPQEPTFVGRVSAETRPSDGKDLVSCPSVELL